MLFYLGGSQVEVIADLGSADIRSRFCAQENGTLLAIKTWYVRATSFFEVPISSKNPPFQKLPYKEMFVFHRFPYVKLHYYSAEQKDALCKYPEYSQAHR